MKESFRIVGDSKYFIHSTTFVFDPKYHTGSGSHITLFIELYLKKSENPFIQQSAKPLSARLS